MLTRVDISHNEFDGSIPSMLLQMTGLEYADLSFNNFEGTFLDKTQMPMIHFLSLESNSLTGTFPIDSMTVPLLEHLNLRENSFEGTLPSHLPFPQMHHFDIFHNNFKGNIPSWVLESIKDSDVSNNR